MKKNPIYKLLIAALILFFSQNSSAQTTWYQDKDADSWGNPNVTQVASNQPVGYVQNNLDCNDNKFNDSKWFYVDTAGFSKGSSVADVSFAKDNNDVFYVAFYDNATKKGNVMKYNGSNWVYVGNPNFTASDAEYISIDVDNNGTPYVAYQDKASNYQTTVKKFDGSSWVTVGYAGISSGSSRVEYTIVKVDNNNVPYVTYRELGAQGQPHTTMKKYNGTSWVSVGPEKFTRGGLYYQSFCFDNNNTPYLALRGCCAYNNMAIVLKYNGTSWDTVGNPGFSSGGIWEPAMAVDHNNVPYMAFTEWNFGNRVTVKKLVGNTWQTVGATGYSQGNSEYVNISIDKAGTPIVAYRYFDAFVQKYNGSSWQFVGNGGFSGGNSRYMNMLLDSLGRPYVAFEDGANGGRVTVMRLEPDTIGSPDTPIVSATKIQINQGDSSVLSVDTGVLNDASAWVWYSGSCGGTKVTPVSANADGSQITVAPTQTTTYYVRGEGPCVSGGVCDSITILVNTVGVGTLEQNVKILIHPNPTKGLLYIDNLKAYSEIGVYSATGQNLISIDTGIGRSNIDISKLPSGVYYLKAKDEQGKNLFEKILKY